jgi:hypothetical protein
MFLCLGLLGQLVLIGGFMLIRQLFTVDILCLDIVVASIAYWLLGLSMIRRPINPHDESDSDVAGLGIKWQSTIFYSLTAIIVMVAGVAMHNSEYSYLATFSVQAFVQALLLVLLFGGLLFSKMSTAKAKQIYQREQQLASGKAELKYIFDDLYDIAATNHHVAAPITQQLKRLAEETRYITPAKSDESHAIESKIYSYANNLHFLLNSPEAAEDQINQLIDNINFELTRRKRVLN